MNARDAWRQSEQFGAIPAVYKPGRTRPLMVRIPYREGNSRFIQADHQHRQRWNKQFRCWETPQSWFEAIVLRLLNEFGQTFVIQEYRQQEKCAPACWNAKGFDCVCSCMGANHGREPDGKWFTVSDTCAMHWRERELSCRLLTVKRIEK